MAESGRADLAAIASANCGGLYGLEALSDHVANTDHNYTRFICISRDLEIYDGANKITFVASASHRPGSLYSLIAKFATRGLNISKLESRPIPGKDFEFRFYFDVEASVKSKDTQTILMDEPTTYLDIRYQIEILELVRRLNREFHITIIMVLHDINQAIYFSDEIIGLKDGKVTVQGEPGTVIERESIERMYGIDLEVKDIGGRKFVLTV